MLLGSTTDSLELIVSPGSCVVHVDAVFTDRNQSTGLVGAADRQLTNISTASTTTIVSSPGVTTSRMIENLFIRNASSTVVVDCVLQYNANATIREIVSFRLFPDDVFVFTLQAGFRKVVANPRLDKFGAQDGNEDTTADVNTHPVNGCSVQIPSASASKRYCFLANYVFRSAITTTGAQFTVNVLNNASNALISTFVGATIQAVLDSVTAAVLSAGATVNLGTPFVSQVTGPTTMTLGMAAGSFEVPAGTPVTVGLHSRSEINNSQVGTEPGTWIHVWEATG